MEKEKVCHEIAMLLMQRKVDAVSIAGTLVAPSNAAETYFEIYTEVSKNYQESYSKYFGEPRVRSISIE